MIFHSIISQGISALLNLECLLYIEYRNSLLVQLLFNRFTEFWETTGMQVFRNSKKSISKLIFLGPTLGALWWLLICPAIDPSDHPTSIIQSIFSLNLAKATLFRILHRVSFGKGCAMALNQVSRSKLKFTADLFEKSLTDNFFYPLTSLAQILPKNCR